jgi:hypothetical protein
MKTKLKGLSIADMLELASTHLALGIISAPDRIARRKKAAMICWFCEHWPGLVIDSRELQAHQTPVADSQAQTPLHSDDVFDEESSISDSDFDSD